MPGALDLCFIAAIPLDDVIAQLRGAALASSRGQSVILGQTTAFARFTCVTPI
ncbi:hypothetical protein CNE_BB1p09180 (plasmid) [Cupriavidus necator N-1]|uniref:Uncharacterized protein n=1 Tax=Cupriavidus necator (strain ATCC 43291 / DSM 13513 / CCUG 52238 / LMG 8453 / N-1) TaxID=1042878 RepID=F8GUC6_CUPNN|nr:hypothetical protein CNE_BB1p09180 [Cupriavidus necator N-1]